MVGFDETPYGLLRLAAASQTGARCSVEGLVGEWNEAFAKRFVQANVGVATRLP